MNREAWVIVQTKFLWKLGTKMSPAFQAIDQSVYRHIRAVARYRVTDRLTQLLIVADRVLDHRFFDLMNPIVRHCLLLDLSNRHFGSALSWHSRVSTSTWACSGSRIEHPAFP